MSENPALSIIVPVYNSEKTITQCLDSILAQTFQNFECILVNDGSTDKSPAICDEYAQKDNRIKVLHKPNEGVSAARNDGIKVACGEYIAFVDSDDTIHTEMYEHLYNNIITRNCDVICCGFTYKNKNYLLSNEYYQGSRPGIIYALDNADLFGVVWNKLYKSKIIKENDIKFPHGCSFGEDFIFSLKYFSFINNAYCIGEIFYFHTDYDTSLTKKRPEFEQSLFRFNNASQIICTLEETNDKKFKNFILARDFIFTVFLIRNLYIPIQLPKRKRIDLLSGIKSFYIENRASDGFARLQYCIFYKFFFLTPVEFFDFVMNIFFKIIYKIRGYS
jgi:glycosyltransferase involved in cell wall biosynthesis